jgi:hypothetical protein
MAENCAKGVMGKRRVVLMTGLSCAPRVVVKKESSAHDMAENCAKGVMEKMRVVLIPWLRTAPRV